MKAVILAIQISFIAFLIMVGLPANNLDLDQNSNFKKYPNQFDNTKASIQIVDYHSLILLEYDYYYSFEPQSSVLSDNYQSSDFISQLLGFLRVIRMTTLQTTPDPEAFFIHGSPYMDSYEISADYIGIMDLQSRSESKLQAARQTMDN